MSKKLAQVFHFDSFGKRQEKYNKLTNTEFDDVDWQELDLKEPYYFFVPKDFESEKEYNKGFSVSDIFIKCNSGIETGKDKELVNYHSGFFSQDLQKFETDYLYRPFDFRFVPFDSSILHRSRMPLMGNMTKNNLGIICKRGITFDSPPIFLSRSPVDRRVFTPAGTQGAESIFPLYLYQDTYKNLLGDDEKVERIPNFNDEVIAKIEKKLKMRLNEDFTPEDLFDYIYSVLHSKSYREKFKEFLKIDFPKVPFNVDNANFFKLVKLGRELRSFHLMDNTYIIVKNFITKYEIDGENEVGKIKYELDITPGSSSKDMVLAPEVKEQELGKVFINDEQCFSGVPKDVWEFYIGGYQPAQKWLKDRKGRKLKYEDILHYSKIILVLQNTIRIMQEIEEV